MIIHIESNTQYEDLLSKGEVLVDFFATWCGPCNMLGPVLEQVAQEHPELTILKVDVDELGGIAMKYGVSSIPALFYFKDGKLVNQTLGFMPKPRLLAFLGK